MNPFNLNPQTQTSNPSEASTTTSAAPLKPTRRHIPVDPRIEEQLLQLAIEDEAIRQGAHAQPQMPDEIVPPNLHREIMIVPNFLTTDICDEYIEYIESQKEIDLSVFDANATNATGGIQWEVDKETRDTQTVDIAPINDAVVDLMRYAVRDFINPYFNVQVKDSEHPQILIYHPGGHYKPHVDAEALFNDGSGTLKWTKNVDRDISMVVYLNDDFDGGEIVFPHQAISVKPRKGLMVAFPSNHHFLHGVNPVTQGTRYAIVNWFSLGITPVFQP